MPVSRSDCPPPGRAEQITTRIAYLVLGVGVSSWAALVPYAKARLGLDEAVLGMLLLCVGVGSLLHAVHRADLRAFRMPESHSRFRLYLPGDASAAGLGGIRLADGLVPFPFGPQSG
ncbi:MAG: hypothetical protein ACLSAH_14340 [Bilophila wadsworthia]